MRDSRAVTIGMCLAAAVAWADSSSGPKAFAQTAYPNQSITVIVPYAAGGAGDVVLRAVSEPMEAKLGQKLIVMARPGAGGNLGAQAVATAAPDGYTLLLGATNNFVTNQFLFPSMTFDPLAEFVPVAKIADVPSVIFTHPSTPAKTLPEFIAYAKANPGKLNFGSPSFGTTPHLAVERLKLMAGIDMVHVPFQGAPPAVQGLLRNDIQLYLGGVAVGAGHIEAGTVKPLAVSSVTRLAALPNVPTISESGVGEFGASNWWLLAAPKGTPGGIVDRLAKAVDAALGDKGVQERYAKFGFVGGTTDAAKISAELKSEAKAWGDVIAKAGIKLPK
jgi:tripartite-type tricarboxylate transporter receptor subunit TctC